MIYLALLILLLAIYEVIQAEHYLLLLGITYYVNKFYHCK